MTLTEQEKEKLSELIKTQTTIKNYDFATYNKNLRNKNNELEETKKKIDFLLTHPLMDGREATLINLKKRKDKLEYDIKLIEENSDAKPKQSIHGFTVKQAQGKSKKGKSKKGKSKKGKSKKGKPKKRKPKKGKSKKGKSKKGKSKKGKS